MTVAGRPPSGTGNVVEVETEMPMPVASSASNSGAFVSASLPTQSITRPEDQASRGRPRKYTKEALASPEVQPRPRGQP
jgi:hypothetical protein